MQLHMSLKIVEASVLMYLTVDEIPPIDFTPYYSKALLTAATFTRPLSYPGN